MDLKQSLSLLKGFESLRKIYIIFSLFQRVLFLILPNIIRIKILRICGATVSSSSYIHPTVHIDFPWRLCIGDNSRINRHVYIDCRGGHITIGSNCDVSEGVILYTLSHDHKSTDMKIKSGAICLLDRVWVGARSIVLPGVTIGEGAVVGALVVISRNINDFALIRALSCASEVPLPKDRSTMLRRDIF